MQPHALGGGLVGRSWPVTAFSAPGPLRCTRLADLVNTLDPKLVAAALGMDPEGVMIYLADQVDVGRLPDT
ncbi:hypothetical protein ACWCXH_31875 [Kitasatospora sp. NPDC001660]